MGEAAREFSFSDRNFSFIQQLAYETTGIKLSDHKRNMVYGRLARRLRALRLDSFDRYCELIKDRDHPEFSEFINSITTNLTSFFRESHHFEFLEKTVIPSLVAKGKKRIRAWSCACSTGEEPYSIAITFDKCLDTRRNDFKLLATDLDSNVVAKAKSGIYSKDRVEALSDTVKKSAFHRQRGADQVMVKDRLKELITFKQLNLLHEWPMKGPFDFVFCRNVVIYFDKDTQKVLFDRIANLMETGSYLFIGHSENLHRVTDRFKSLGRTIYQKIK